MKLYLLKYKHKISGPVSIHQLKKLANSRKIHSGHKISASCQEWVRLDDPDLLYSVYPDVYSIVSAHYEDWGVGKDQKRRRKKQNKNPASLRLKPQQIKINASNRPKTKYYLAFVIVSVIVGFGLFSFYKSDQQQTQKMFADPKATKMPEQLFAGEFEQFKTSMNQYYPRIKEVIEADRSKLYEWLPYIRAYAFMGDGQVDGITQAELMGDGEGSPFLDCSTTQWGSVWSQAKPTISETKPSNIARDSMLEVLNWDANWIKSRRYERWFYPQNPYHACLIVSLKSAYVELGSSEQFLNVTHRLRKQVVLINQPKVKWSDLKGRDDENIKPWSIFSCSEYAGSLGEMEECDRDLTDLDLSNLGPQYLIAHLVKKAKLSQGEGRKSILNEIKSLSLTQPELAKKYQMEIDALNLTLSQQEDWKEAASQISSALRGMTFE